jgi:hypothetical protein
MQMIPNSPTCAIMLTDYWSLHIKLASLLRNERHTTSLHFIILFDTTILGRN